MKSFVRVLTRTVRLSHGVGDEKETLEITLRPCPVGFLNQLERQFPPPVQYVNGKETPAPTQQMRAYQSAFNLCVLGWQLGSEVTTEWPGNQATAEGLQSYAKSLATELEGAGLTEGDLQQLFTEAIALNNGSGVLGKAT